MFEPCFDHCYIRYNKQYTKECDDNCNYAKVVKENKCKDEIIEFLLDALEDEHMGMRAWTIEKVKDKFGIEY